MLSFSSSQPDAAQNIQTMRLRDDPPPITQPQRTAKKRKTPPAEPPPNIQVALIHTLPGNMPPGYPYGPTDYTPGGIPQNAHPAAPIQQPQQQPESPPQSAANRTLSNSKRAEQNRKAQRAFRERRDQHVKALESRSVLLDAALASADEANRRWEECRALVDQLRVENAALRAALGQAHLLPPTLANPNGTLNPNGGQQQQQQADPNNNSDPNEQPTNDNGEKSSD